MAETTKDKQNKESKGNILVFCAHPDDEVLGVGSTIAKYAKEGYHITTVIFSYGESSHPWLQRKITVQTRVKESNSASSILGCAETLFLGLKEGQFLKQLNQRKAAYRIKELIKEKKPVKIFVHSIDDPHPDHKAMNKVILHLVAKSGIRTEVYTFDIWNPLNIRNRNLPLLVVDVSETYRVKARALQKFKSQKIAMFILIPLVYTKALINGFTHNLRFADVFYRVEPKIMENFNAVR
ncbi:MAG: PIG-L deacetylase family protein [Nanoarchaeota archaeon]|nr:PIG-L deacetylase family protein [Nanoarchaeota archaeon]